MCSIRCRSFPQVCVYSARTSLVFRHSPARSQHPFLHTLVKPHPCASELGAFPATGFEQIGSEYLVEEEAAPGYKAEKYYPVQLGEIFNKKYRVIGKLGCGTSSTVWLCRDLMADKHITLKVMVHTQKEHREISIYDHLRKIQSDHVGRRYARELLDSFEISGPRGQHMCLVHSPLGRSLSDMKKAARSHVFHKELLKRCLRRVLIALDYLHKEARIVHTDIQPNNLLMEVNDLSIFSEFEQDQFEHPVARKVLEDRTIYTSRAIQRATGLPLVSDFGEARFGDEDHYEDIMPNEYRAPEVILGMRWSYEVDIWSVAMMAWDLFEPDRIFEGRSPDGKYDDGYHLAEMVAIMGAPPLEFLQRTENSLRYWDEQGNWRGVVPIPEISLELLERRLDDDDLAGFLRFIRSMLRWLPEERPNAEECVFDDWLMEGLFGPDGPPKKE